MASKLGWHINFPTDPDLMVAQAARAKPAVIVYLNLGDARTAWRLQEASPETLIIGRRFVESQPLGDPIDRAWEMVSGILSSPCAREGAIKTFMLYNEIGPHITADYSAFGVEGARLLHAEGMKHAAGSWSVGTPEVLPIYPNGKSDWTSELMVRVLQVTDYIATHSYCAPRMDDPRGLDGAHPGEGWFTARFVKARRLLMEAQLGFALPPWVITECGIDSGATKWDAGGQGGWRSFTDAPGYLEQLAWYDLLLRLYPWMIGAAIFCYGDISGDWDDFDISGEMAELLTQYMEASHGQIPGPPAYPDWLTDMRSLLPRAGSYDVREGGLEAVRRIVIHHSQSAPTTGPWQIAEYHIAPEPAGKGWPEHGYHADAAVDGRVWQCLDWEKHGYHAGPANGDSIGICLLGDFRYGDEPPESQLAGVRRLIGYLESLLRRPLEIVGHKDVMDGKTCPGDTWDVWKHRLLGGPDPEPDWERMYHESAANVDVLEGGVTEIIEIGERVMA